MICDHKFGQTRCNAKVIFFKNKSMFLQKWPKSSQIMNGQTLFSLHLIPPKEFSSGFSLRTWAANVSPQTLAFFFLRRAAIRFFSSPHFRFFLCAFSRQQALSDRNGCLGRGGEGVSNEQEHRCWSGREGSWCMVKCQVRTTPPSTRESSLNL